MHKILTFVFLIAFYWAAEAQITVQLSSLPDIGDQLRYQAIVADSLGAKIDNQVFQTGGNLSWDFSNLPTGIEVEEVYQATTVGAASDSFPDADMIIDFFGLAGYAKRNTTNITILGVTGDSIAGLNVPIIGRLDDPFVVRRAPFGFNDQFASSTSFDVTIEASALDTIEQFQDFINNIPGTTADSLRITVQIDRNEDVNGWGTLMLPSGSREVLKVTLQDVVTTKLEIYAVTLLGSGWIDLTPFLPEELQEFASVTTTSHLFYGEENKEVIAEFTMAPDSTQLNGRYARDITSSLFAGGFQNQIEVTLFPNPTSNEISLRLPTNQDLTNLKVEILDLLGQRIQINSLSSARRVDVSTISPGIYLFNLYDSTSLLYSERIFISPQ